VILGLILAIGLTAYYAWRAYRAPKPGPPAGPEEVKWYLANIRVWQVGPHGESFLDLSIINETTGEREVIGYYTIRGKDFDTIRNITTWVFNFTFNRTGTYTINMTLWYVEDPVYEIDPAWDVAHKIILGEDTNATLIKKVKFLTFTVTKVPYETGGIEVPIGWDGYDRLKTYFAVHVQYSPAIVQTSQALSA